MPVTKHKRKMGSPTHGKHKGAGASKSSGIIGSHPTTFIYIGIALIVVGLVFLMIGIQNDALFGLAMLSIVSGTAVTILANFSLSAKKVSN